jgi:hypothetical protein
LKSCGDCGKCVERTRLLARRHEELTCALRRRRDQHRGLDLDEPLSFHARTDRGVDGGTYPQVLLHALASQVEVPVLEADVLVDVVGAGVDREGRWVGLAQHLDLAFAQLDLAGRQVLVDGALGALTHDTRDPQHVLAADVDVVVDDALGRCPSDRGRRRRPGARRARGAGRPIRTR